MLPNAPRASYVFAALATAAFVLAGCTPAIGDRCTLSTDCSAQGNRLCDTTQPNGYCTIVPCTASSCPDNAACVEIGASVPGCAYDDYSAPSRVGMAMCLKTCSSDSDCRQSDGYTCGSPTGPTRSAVILDPNQSARVCLIANPAGAQASFVDAAVCSSNRLDAAPFETSASTRGGEGGAESGVVEGEGDAEAGPGGDAQAPEEGDATVQADSVSTEDAQRDATLGDTTDSTIADDGADE